eukprot:15061562-Heterocapsa_arctica.AAC.1
MLRQAMHPRNGFAHPPLVLLGIVQVTFEAVAHVCISALREAGGATLDLAQHLPRQRGRLPNHFCAARCNHVPQPQS